MESRGRAIAVLKYCSGLACFVGENTLFGFRPKFKPEGCFGPQLWENDSFLHYEGWLEPNVRFLRETLSYDYVLQKVLEAAQRLANEPEHELSMREAAEIRANRELVEHRITELPRLLSSGEPADVEGWSI